MRPENSFDLAMIQHEYPIHVFMLSLCLCVDGKQTPVAVMIQHDKAEFLLCTLGEKIHQQTLDLNFSEGEDVTFFLNGKGKVSFQLTKLNVAFEETVYNKFRI